MIADINFQTVFIVRNIQCPINESWEDDLYKYIPGMVQYKI